MDIEKICNIVELKVDQGEYDKQLRQVKEHYAPLNLVDTLKEQIRLKADRHDYESLVTKQATLRIDIDHLTNELSKDFKALEQDVYATQEVSRQFIQDSLRLKADFSLVERIQT